MQEFAIQMQGFTGLTILTLLFLFASIVLVATNRTVNRKARHAFLGTLIAIALIVAADWVNLVAGYGQAQLRLFHLATMSLTFAVAPILPVVIANTIFPDRHARIVLLLLACFGIFELANIFYPLVFTVDASNVYSRGQFYWVYMLSYCISSVYLTVESIRASTTYQAASTVAVIAILLCMLGGVAIQIASPMVRMSWTAVAMAVTLYFYFHTETVLRTDALTLLLNRHGYEEFLAHPLLPCTVVLVDVDNFKQVNDKYGHDYGDEALRTLAHLTRKSFGHTSRCYRIGGDEYCVVLVKQHHDVEVLIARLNDAIAQAQSHDERLPSVSVGYASADSHSGVREAIRAADATMYAAKRARKEQAKHTGAR